MSQLGGDFEKLIFNALQASEEGYDPDFHTEEKCKEDAEVLYKMGEGYVATSRIAVSC